MTDWFQNQTESAATLSEETLRSAIEALMDDPGYIPCGTQQRPHLVHPHPATFLIDGVEYVICHECAQPVRWTR